MDLTSFTGTYDLRLVAASIAIAICSAYAALDLGARTTAAAARKAKSFWLAGGALSLGTGIWAMHYVGMLAYNLPIPVLYDLPTVGASYLAAILASAFALYVVSKQHIRPLYLPTGGLVMGAGISAMHYIGMFAMRLSAHAEYDPTIVLLSIAIAIVIAYGALWITVRLRNQEKLHWPVRLANACLMGVAIALMHYTGMRAVCFHHSPHMSASAHPVQISFIGALSITAITFLLLLLTLACTMTDRYLNLQREIAAQSKRDYRLIFDQNLGLVIRTKLSGEILGINEAGLIAFGFQNESEIIGMNASQFYMNSKDRHTLMQRLQNEGTVKAIEICLKHRDGSPIWLIQNMTLCEATESAEAQIITNSMDISALKKVQTDLVKAKEQAELASRVKSQFLANMSHELRTPLNGVLGMVTLALDCPVSDEVGRYLDAAKGSADILISIVDRILTFARDGSPVGSPVYDLFELSGLISNAQQTVADSATDKHLHLLSSVEPDLPRFFQGDVKRIEQVLQILLDNAVKFTNEGSVLVEARPASSSPQESCIHFAVCDTGIGIEADKLELIFEAFTQVDSSNTRQYGGTGLGLAVCSRLVRAIRGRIWVESSVDVGSTFHFEVPVRAVSDDEEADHSSLRSQSLTGSASLTVAI